MSQTPCAIWRGERWLALCRPCAHARFRAAGAAARRAHPAMRPAGGLPGACTDGGAAQAALAHPPHAPQSQRHSEPEPGGLGRGRTQQAGALRCVATEQALNPTRPPPGCTTQGSARSDRASAAGPRLAGVQQAEADGVLPHAHEAARAVDRVQHPVPPLRARGPALTQLPPLVPAPGRLARPLAERLAAATRMAAPASGRVFQARVGGACMRRRPAKTLPAGCLATRACRPASPGRALGG